MRQRLAIQVEGHTPSSRCPRKNSPASTWSQAANQAWTKARTSLWFGAFRSLGLKRATSCSGDREPSRVGCVLKRHGLLVCRRKPLNAFCRTLFRQRRSPVMAILSSLNAMRFRLPGRCRSGSVAVSQDYP